MKKLILISTLFSLVTLPAVGRAECDRPWPVPIPNAESASKEDMLAAQRAVKDYMASAEAYLACVDEELAAIDLDQDDWEASRQATMEQKFLNRRYEAAAEEMMVLADRYNQTVRAYKAREEAPADR